MKNKLLYIILGVVFVFNIGLIAYVSYRLNSDTQIKSKPALSPNEALYEDFKDKTQSINQILDANPNLPQEISEFASSGLNTQGTNLPQNPEKIVGSDIPSEIKNSTDSIVLNENKVIDLKDFVVNNLETGEKIIIAKKDQVLPNELRSLVNTDARGINYVFSWKDNKLSYLDPKIQYIQDFRYKESLNTLSLEYVDGFGYPKFFLTRGGNKNEIRLPINTPLEIYPNKNNPDLITIVAFESNGLESTEKIFDISLNKIIEDYDFIDD